MIEFVQDKCDLLNSYAVGQDVKVSINLRGREWINPQGEAKYFNSVQGWRVENISQTDSQNQNLPPVDQFQPAPDVSNEEPDDLPF
jgi:translation initiation factor IF-3